MEEKKKLNILKGLLQEHHKKRTDGRVSMARTKVKFITFPFSPSVNYTVGLGISKIKL